jgi:hypothetical protein
MTKNQKGSELCLTDWTWTSDSDGKWFMGTIRDAAITESARRLIRMEQHLSTIVTLLNALGADGIHTVIRQQATKARKAERLRRQRAAAKRAATRARKQQAQAATHG